MTAVHTPSIADQPRYDCRDAYVETLAELAEADHRIVGVVNDSVGSSKLNSFRKAFPDRLINVGIAEQDLVGVGAGLANGGMIPFVSALICSSARPVRKQDAAETNGIRPPLASPEATPTMSCSAMPTLISRSGNAFLNASSLEEPTESLTTPTIL